MAKVLGIGGVFFRCEDQERLALWYRRWLGLPVDPEHVSWGASFQPGEQPAGACAVWGPFSATTEYFEPSDRQFMVNLIVDDLEGALAQVKEGGAQIVGEIESHDYGRFGWFVDPEGTKVELWEPAVA